MSNLEAADARRWMTIKRGYVSWQSNPGGPWGNSVLTKTNTTGVMDFGDAEMFVLVSELAPPATFDYEVIEVPPFHDLDDDDMLITVQDPTIGVYTDRLAHWRTLASKPEYAEVKWAFATKGEVMAYRYHDMTVEEKHEFHRATNT